MVSLSTIAEPPEALAPGDDRTVAAESDNFNVLYKLAGKEDLDPEAASILLYRRDVDVSVLQKLVASQDLSLDDQRYAMRIQHLAVQDALAHRRTTHPEIQEALYRAEHLNVNGILVDNPGLCAKVQELIYKEEPSRHYRLVRNKNLAPSVQARFLQDKVESGYYLEHGDPLAINPALTPEHQMVMARDYLHQHSSGLAANPRITEEVQLFLKKNADGFTISTLAMNLAVTPKVQVLLTFNPSPAGERYLVANPSLQLQAEMALSFLLKNFPEWVQRQVPSEHREAFEIFAKDETKPLSYALEACALVHR